MTCKPPFADGGTEMRYVVVTKQQSGKEKAVSSATFYEFNIAADNFFDWIGNLGYTETLDKGCYQVPLSYLPKRVTKKGR